MDIWKKMYVSGCFFSEHSVEQNLLLTAYRKSIGTKMNDLDLCLEVDVA